MFKKKIDNDTTKANLNSRGSDSVEKSNLQMQVEDSLGVDSQDQKKPNIKPKEKKKRFVWAKDIGLGLLNLVFIIGLVYILSQLPIKSAQLKSLREAAYKPTVSNLDVQKFELDKNAEDISKLKAVFPNEEGLIKYVDELEKIKADGTIVGYSFASKDPVRDKSKNSGFPVIIEFAGSWENIERDMKRVQELPFLFRVVSVDAEELIENGGVIDLRYGGFLYVDKSLEKN